MKQGCIEKEKEKGSVCSVCVRACVRRSGPNAGVRAWLPAKMLVIKFENVRAFVAGVVGEWTQWSRRLVTRFVLCRWCVFG
jgi:hypothetical protein